MEQAGRKPLHQRVPELERLLAELNAIVEAGVLARTEAWTLRPLRPTILVVGCARSGTTLLMQWLAASHRFAYPTNLASRIYASPLVGALLHRALVELDVRGEIVPIDSQRIDYASNLGKTSGAAQPHEYWYWWRRFFAFGETQKVSDEALANVDVARLLHELAQLEGVFGKPVALKAMLLNWNLPFLGRTLPKPIFVNMLREPAANAASLLSARESFYGDPRIWYSFKPPEYAMLARADPDVQVAGQVLANRRAVAAGLADASDFNRLDVEYERFCADPGEVWGRIADRIQALGGAAPGPYAGPSSFETPRRVASTRWTDALAEAERLLGGAQ